MLDLYDSSKFHNITVDRELAKRILILLDDPKEQIFFAVDPLPRGQVSIIVKKEARDPLMKIYKRAKRSSSVVLP